jgi:hypothetical protein
MAQAKSMSLQANGHVFQLLFKKYGDAHVSTVPQTREICVDMLLLPSGQTFADFEVLVVAAFKSQPSARHSSLPEIRNEAFRQEFNTPFAVMLQQQKEALCQRYAAACASGDPAYQVAELRACAREGHLQASLDLGMRFDAEGNHECIGCFVEAHNLGHPESLLCLSKTFLKTGNAADAVRVLLLGASSGSIRCAQALLLILERRLQIFEVPECLAALDESRANGSIYAMYLLGFVLCHGGESCRDELRGRALMVEAGGASHSRGDKGKGAPLVEGGNQYAAGTLAHFKVLIDRELLAINSKQLMPKFLARAAALRIEPGDEAREAFEKLFNEFDPVPKRLNCRVFGWLANGDTAPVDEAKLERMKALFAEPDEDASKEGRDE